MIADDLDSPSLYLDLENPQDFQKLQDAQLYLQRYKDHLVILDEAHRKPDLFPLLRSLIDEYRRPGRFMILGSAAPSLKRQASESLAGRIAYHELSPFTLDETIDIQPDYTTLWFRGGYPESFLAASDNVAMTWLGNFIQTHLERDLPALGVRVPATTLLRFWTMAAHCTAQLWNANKLADSLGVDSKTTRRYLDTLEETFMIQILRRHFLLEDILGYLDTLEETFMIRQLQPFFSNTKKRLVKSPKIYIRDTGILHQILKIQCFDDLISHPVLGASWEGFCIEQILAIKPSTYDACFYRTQSAAAAEIDLVLTKGLSIEIAVEIKYSLAPKLTKSSMLAIDAAKPKKTWVVYPGTESYPLRHDIWTLPIHQLGKLFG